MEVISSWRPLGAVLVSIGAFFLILATGEKRPNLREAWSVGAAIVKFLLVFSLRYPVLEGKIVECRLFPIAPGADLLLRVDSFGLLFGLVASFLWIFTTFYSIGYMRGLAAANQTRYFACFALALSATIGVAFSGNLITFYIFYEILTISTYPLVIHKETEEALRAGRKYLTYTLTAGVFLLFSIALTQYLAGTTGFKAGGFLDGVASPKVLTLLFVTFMIGCGTKAAIMPLHSWLPTAMIAPTPVSALLHAVAVVKAGVFGCVRILGYVFGPELLRQLGLIVPLGLVSSATIIVASVFALSADNLKRRLAFSTISQLSYIILGVALFTPDSFKGGLLHIPFHAFMKITLFFCAGAIYVTTHKENVSELDGIGKAMPLTLGAFAIGAFGMVGVPPICGYLSKWYLCVGTVEAHKPLFLGVYLSSALLNAAYFLPIVYNGFFKGEGGPVKEASPFMVISLLITAAGAFVLGIFPDFLLKVSRIASYAMTEVLGG